MAGSRPSWSASGRTAARIDCPEMRMCRPVRLLFASNAPTSLHCVTGWYRPCVMSSSRDQIIFTGVPGICLAIRTAWVT